MKKTLVISASLLLCAAAFAQKPAGDPKGGISPQMLKEISAAYEGNAADKALRNALNSTPISALALSTDNLAMIDTHFSHTE